MKLGVLSTAALFGATMLFGQATGAQTAIPRETSQSVSVESPSISQTFDTTTAVGRVTGFNLGKSVTITTPGNKTKTFDLTKEDTTVYGNPNVRVGELVSITETTQAQRRTINIEPYTRGVRTDTATEAAIMQAETQASGQAPNEISRTVTRATPMGTVKTTTTSNVGQVTEYKQGKSLTITAPHNSTKKYNLSKVAITGDQNLRVGEFVKVTETKQPNQTTIHIQPVSTRRAG
jgi:hypothetical protein